MDGLEVRTTAGVVRGVPVGDDVVTWRGIPYAVADRFAAPHPPRPWTGVRDAAAFGPIAPQPRSRLDGTRRAVMSEDCLSLNVVAPAAPGPPRPVLVWIHGGAFVAGSSSVPGYRGYALVRAGDVVYVSVNYRLGALGFLGPRDGDAVSNPGLRDQVAALEWVRDNVAAFGGDPGNVTVFGESAGGTSVTTLLAVPAARGLFHRAIAQSPAAGAAYSAERAAGWAAHLGGLLGATPDDAGAVLRAAPAERLVAATSALSAWSDDTTPGVLCTSPVVDGDFLPAHPLDVLTAGDGHPVPLLIGTNDREAMLFHRFPGNLLPTTCARLDRMFAATDPSARARVLAAYPGRGAAVDVAGDHAFWIGSLGVAAGHAAPTFMYRYDFAPRLLRLAGFGATHACEIAPVFGEVDDGFARTITALGGRDALRAVSARMQAHWLHFARHGVPGPGWPAYDTATRATVVFDETDRVEPDPRAARRRAWEGFADYR